MRSVLPLALLFCAGSLHAAPYFLADPPVTSCPLTGDDQGMTVEAAAAHGELWVRTRRGSLTDIVPRSGEVIAAPFRAWGLTRSSRGEIWAATYDQQSGAGIVWQRDEDGWKRIYSAPLRATGLVGIPEMDGDPAIVTSRMLLTPHRTVAFSGSLPFSSTAWSFAFTRDSFWVGVNDGEWGGGIRRIALADGEPRASGDAGREVGEDERLRAATCSTAARNPRCLDRGGARRVGRG
jgi:hypothetical protein